ncbi:MAG TPA: alpha/beta hydrolase, partial [Mycobacterium sp.]
MQRRHRIRVLSTPALALSVLLAGCAPGLAANPRFATDSGAQPQGRPQTSQAPQGPPPIEPVKNDLSWRDCTSRVFSDA